MKDNIDLKSSIKEDPEVMEWYAMTPEERFLASMKLWETYILLGGSLEPEPDTQSPFYFAKK